MNNNPTSSIADLYSGSQIQGSAGPSIGFSDTPTQQTQTQPTIPQQPQESWWKKLLPVAGALGGGILGEFVDPFGGGLVGAALAGSLFGGAGQAVGKGFENVLTNQDVGKGVLSNFAQGAVFGGFGKGLGSVIGGTGKALDVAGTKAIANLDKSQMQAAQKLADLSKQKATQLNFSGVTGDTAERNFLKNNQAFMDKMNLPSHSPHAMDQTGQAFYDTLGAERTAAQDAAGNASTKGVLGNISRAFEMNRGTPFDDIFNTWANRADVSVIDKATGIARKPSINDFMENNIPPSQIQKLREEIGTSAESYKQLAERSTSPNAMQQAKNTASVLSQINKSLEPVVNSEAANKLIADRTLTAAERAGYTTKYGDEFGNYLADTIDKAKSVQDLTSELKTGVQMKNISKEAIADLQNTSSKSAGARMEASNDGYGGIADPNNLTPPEENLLQHAINAIKVAAGGGGKLSKAMQLADIAAKTKILPATARKTGTLLSRISSLAAPTALGAGAFASSAAGGPAGNGQQAIQPQGATMQQSSPLQGLLGQAINQYILDPSDFGTSAGNTIAGLMPMLQQQARAQSQLDAVRQLYQGAGGAGGLGGTGLFNQIASALPFTQQAAALRQANALAGQLGLPANLSFLQNPQTAGAQLSVLQNAINAMGGNMPNAMPSM